MDVNHVSELRSARNTSNMAAVTSAIATICLIEHGVSLKNHLDHWKNGSPVNLVYLNAAEVEGWRESLGNAEPEIVIAGPNIDPAAVFDLVSVINSEIKYIAFVFNLKTEPACLGKLVPFLMSLKPGADPLPYALIMEDELVELVEGAVSRPPAGCAFISKGIRSAIAMSSAPAPAGAPASKPLGEAADKLTERELQVLQLAAKGLRQKEIAKVLSLSRHTISGYFKSMYDKLGVNSCTEALFEATKLGYSIQ